MMSNMHVSELLAKLSMMVTEEEKKSNNIRENSKCNLFHHPFFSFVLINSLWSGYVQGMYAYMYHYQNNINERHHCSTYFTQKVNLRKPFILPKNHFAFFNSVVLSYYMVFIIIIMLPPAWLVLIA